MRGDGLLNRSRRFQLFLLGLLLAGLVGCNTVNATDGFADPDYAGAYRLAAKGDVAALSARVEQGLAVNRLVGLEGVRLPDGRPHEVTLLQWAVAMDDPVAVESLLKVGADPDVLDSTRRTALIYATTAKHPRILALLLEHGADPNIIAKAGLEKTALSYALSERNWDYAELLLRHGANVNIDLGRGTLPVVRHAYLHQWPAVRWLIEHGADLEDKEVRRTLVCRVRNSYRVHPELLPEGQVARDAVRAALIARGVDAARLDPANYPSRKCDEPEL
jgi:hypothetical protein